MNRQGRISSRSKNNEEQDKTQEEKCAEFNKAVKENDKALQCQICRRWVHTNGGKKKISDEIYRILTEQPDTGLHFYCSICDISTVGII